MMKLIGRISKIGSRTGKKKAQEKKEIFSVNVRFNNSKNYDAYASDLAVTMRIILCKDNLKVDYDWEKCTVRFSLDKNRAILCKSKKEIDLIVNTWKRKMREMLICKKFKVESDPNPNYETGVIRLYLK